MDLTPAHPRLNMTRHINKTVTILQHNLRHWKTHKYAFYNIYKDYDPNIILLNEHGNKSTEKIKLFGYQVHQNMTEEQHDGVAIAIKKKASYIN